MIREARSEDATSFYAQLSGNRATSCLLGSRPIAMADINALAADIVQLRRVAVPSEARDAGARQALSFADNPAAERAYFAIGFGPVGYHQPTYWSEPQNLGKGL